MEYDHTAAALSASDGSTWNLDSYAESHGWQGVGIVLSQNRDSDALERSNFAVALERLAGEPYRDGAGDTMYGDSVAVASLNHWAVGWVEWLTFDTGRADIVAAADAITASIANYPALDESDWSEREYAENHPEPGYCYADRVQDCHVTDDRHRITAEWRTLARTMLAERYGTLDRAPILGSATYHGRLWHRLTGRTSAENGQLGFTL